jgi:hypothetical protein
MRTIGKYVIAAFLAAILAPGCGENYDDRAPFDNTAYINIAETGNVENVVFKRTITELERSFAAKLAYPAESNVEVSFAVEPSLVAAYNAKHGTALEMLPAAHYALPENKAVVPAGEAVSGLVGIEFKGLDQLEIDASYLVPLTIENVTGGVGILDGSKTVYYIVRRSSAITTAANLKDNWFSVPTFEQVGAGPGDVVMDMPAITYEALIQVSDFAYGGPKNPTGAIISTIMGCEQHFLMRIGDDGFPLEQLQVEGPAGKFPEADKGKLLNRNEWYHIALTWDIAAKVITFYVNGQEQSRSDAYGTSDINSISLKNSVHGFFIGRSFGDDARTLNGNISEARIWNVARTQQEIWDNMYDVDPATEGLVAYWKFDEPGNIVKDMTGNGNDAVADHDVLWPEGIEIPQINREN